ncbi:EamA family transporter [Paenibacillus wynnii]|uniref:EamA family transporter n=1 Tax=Paenibacillus wynnii TaxID=268407 RepID=UPI00279400AF|nr:DMT family transporter [Paenibacillus wynnii]MDQ0195557.1 drug/metabolite transporter (DMT)-like permease [Paenibacillus wynnii]
MLRAKGFLMASGGALLWGVSGTVAQHLFQQVHISAAWLVTLRLMVAGVIFLLLSLRQEGSKVWRLWLDKDFIRQMLIFGMLGMLGVQYTYFASIEAGNAAIATLLQYLAPLFILLYTIVWKKTRLVLLDFIGAALALAGTYLLLTGGDSSQLAVSLKGLIWGILSGISLAFYTLYSGPLIKKYSVQLIMGWGMLVGGVGMNIVHPIWATPNIEWSPAVIGSILFVVLLGTLAAFYLYIGSLHYIAPHEASLLSCTEPISAIISSVIWLSVPFNLFQALGAGLIVLMTLLISLKSIKEPELKRKARETSAI